MVLSGLFQTNTLSWNWQCHLTVRGQTWGFTHYPDSEPTSFCSNALLSCAQQRSNTYQLYTTFNYCDILELFRQCDILELFRQCDILELFRQFDILELFRQCDILELFEQCDILELFRQCDILELFRQCDMFVFHFISPK